MEPTTAPTSPTSKEILLTPLTLGLTCLSIPVVSQNNSSTSTMPTIIEMPMEISSEVSHPSGHPSTIITSMDDYGSWSEEKIQDIQWELSTHNKSEHTSGLIQNNGSKIVSMPTEQSINGNHYTLERTNTCCSTYLSSMHQTSDMNKWNNKEKLGIDSMPMD